MERLQRILASHGVASRRASEQLILDGKVKVNGKVVRELGTKADPTKDRIEVEGQPAASPNASLSHAEQAVRLYHHCQ